MQPFNDGLGLGRERRGRSHWPGSSDKGGMHNMSPHFDTGTYLADMALAGG